MLPMFFRRYLLWTVSALLLPAAAWAAGKDVDARERAARAACLAGDYAKGAGILSDLFVATEDPVFIYNQGRCFEQNHRYEDAISRFQEYLRVARNMSKAAKAEAQKHISECRNLLAQGAGPTAAAKAQPDTKEGKEKAAKKACLTGDAVGGVAILTDLFIETADPTYLFNQGRCFEQNRRYEDAIGRFREYLVKAKNLRPEDKEDTKKHIADCESYVRDKGGEPAKHEPRKVKDESSGPGASQAVDEAHPAGVKALATGQDSARTGVGLRVAGLVLAGVGGAALVTGMVLNLKANQLSKDVQADWDPSVESSRKTYQTAGWVAYGGGAASLAAGALFYYLGWRARESGETVAFVPTVTPTMAGASFVGAF